MFALANWVNVPYGASGRRFRPSDLANLAAWYRFGMGITSAANAVSQWADQSGNARHLKQPTGAAQPALQADGSIVFDGTSDYLKTDPFTLIQPETVYVLGRQITWTSTDRIFDGASGLNSGCLAQIGTTPGVRVYAGGAASQAENAGWALNTYAVVAAVLNAGTSLIQVNNNTPTTAAASIGTNNMGGLTLGAASDATLFGNIQIEEVVVYAAAHDAATRTSVIAYLAGVGGLSI